MTPEAVLTVGRSALQLGLLVASPLLLTALVVGIVVGLLQAATQVQEQALPFVLKLFAVAAVLAIGGGWMLRLLVEFARGIRNQVTELFAGELRPAPYPVQRALMVKVRAAAEAANDVSRMQAWAGQGAALSSAEPAGELVRRLWTEAAGMLP